MSLYFDWTLLVKSTTLIDLWWLNIFLSSLGHEMWPIWDLTVQSVPDHLTAICKLRSIFSHRHVISLQRDRDGVKPEQIHRETVREPNTTSGNTWKITQCSLSFCRHPPPAVWSAAQQEAAWMPCDGAHRPQALLAGQSAGTPRPRTCSAINPRALNSDALAVGEQPVHTMCQHHVMVSNAERS